ncbi:hypothetical protein Goshw_005020 [Gossypium schwendimanii]|uniref:DUF7745 domain-containing protein n=1 Tax=Gossypium schwendimanii TaxID=34291 RepID=A0A7J9N2H2_GOSSC|nr:hypothetical protein [Gossypium schwendimanii]
MEREFLGKVEDNMAIRVWSKKVKQEKGDSFAEGYTSELWDFTHISVTQNSLQELKEIWDQWDNGIKQLFYSNYGGLHFLLDVKVDKRLFRALAQYRNPTYSCFTFGKVDLVPTVEEYTTLLQCPKTQIDKAYSRADLILAHPDVKKRVDIFALSIYGLVIFPKALGHVDGAVSDLFDRLDNGVSPSLLEGGKGFLSSLFRKLLPIKGTSGHTEMVPDKILYRYGDFDWVPLLGIWGAVGYTPLLVLR